MSELIKVLAKLKLFSGENMRQTPFFSKYRPVFNFDGAITKISGRIDLIGEVKSFAPGALGIVQLSFIKGIISDTYFKEGEIFTISEGGEYILGEGEILKLL
jgi:translation elongation factor EF-Tu-like GTPase